MCFTANNILPMHNWNHTWVKNGRKLPWAVGEWVQYENKLGDWMIKQLLLNSVIAQYCDLSVSHRSIICLSFRLLQRIDLLTTDKWQYFAQPCPITINYCTSSESHLEKNKNLSTLGVEWTYLKTKHKSPVFVKSLEIQIIKRKNQKNIS